MIDPLKTRYRFGGFRGSFMVMPHGVAFALGTCRENECVAVIWNRYDSYAKMKRVLMSE